MRRPAGFLNRPEGFMRRPVGFLGRPVGCMRRPQGVRRRPNGPRIANNRTTNRTKTITFVLPLWIFFCFIFNKLSWVGLGHLARGVKLPPRKRPRLSGNSSDEDSSSQNRQQRDNQQDEDYKFRPASLDLLLFYFNKKSLAA